MPKEILPISSCSKLHKASTYGTRLVARSGEKLSQDQPRDLAIPNGDATIAQTPSGSNSNTNPSDAAVAAALCSAVDQLVIVIDPPNTPREITLLPAPIVAHVNGVSGIYHSHAPMRLAARKPKTDCEVRVVSFPARY